jgi:hypothetical protein
MGQSQKRTRRHRLGTHNGVHKEATAVGEIGATVNGRVTRNCGEPELLQDKRAI